MNPWSIFMPYDSAGCWPCSISFAVMWAARPASDGTIFFGTCSHTSGGPRCSSSSPMAICGRPSRKKFVKCSPVIMTMACTPVSRAVSRTFSRAEKKLSACCRGAEPGSAVIIGACAAE